MQTQPLSQLNLEQLLNKSLTNRSGPTRDPTPINGFDMKENFCDRIAENPSEIKEIMKGKIEYLKSLSNAEREFAKIGSQTRKRKAVSEIISEAIQILKIYGIKLNVINKELKKDYFIFSAVADDGLLANALLDIVLQLNEIPYAFLKKLKIKEITICDILHHYGDKEKSKEYLKKKILSGVYPLQVKDMFDARTFVKKVALTYYLKVKSSAYDEWKNFCYSIEDFLKVSRSDPMQSLFETWNFILERSDVLPNKLRDLKSGKLLSMLSDFDSASFKPVENLKIGKINKADLAF